MKRKILKNSFLFSATIFFSLSAFFVYFYSNDVLAQSTDSDEVIVTLDVTAGISIDSPIDISMSRNLGVVADTAVASSTWTVRTNNATGYNLTVKASTTPAMQQNSTTTIADFPTGTPAAWNGTTVPSGTAKFGFSAYGDDVSTGVWGSGADCQSSSHVPSATLNYLGFTTNESSPVVANRTSTTTPSGNTTTVCYAVQQNGFYIPSGTYTAIITATAVTI